MNVGFARLAEPFKGAWTFQGFPARVQLLGRTFAKATWAAPYPHVVAQYREAVDHNALHLMVHDDGTWSADHTDDANPDRGLVLEHTLRDVIQTPVGAALFTLTCFAAAAAVGWGVARALRTR